MHNDAKRAAHKAALNFGFQIADFGFKTQKPKSRSLYPQLKTVILNLNLNFIPKSNNRNE